MATYRYGISIDFRRLVGAGSRKELLGEGKTLSTATVIIAQLRSVNPLCQLVGMSEK
jgi:hypothetical protein